MHSTDNVDDGYLGSGRALVLAIKKYGKENFTREMLCVCKTKEEAFKNEAIFIKEYKTLTSENGYNLSVTGGTECCGRHSKESKKKMRDKAFCRAILQYSLEGDLVKKWGNAAITGRSLNIDSRNIRACAMGIQPSAYGSIWVFRDSKKEVKDIHKWVKELVTRRANKKPANSKSILQYSLNGDFVKEWESGNSVQRRLGFSRGTIGSCLYRKKPTAHGFIWRFKGDVKDITKISKEVKEDIEKRKQRGDPLSKPLLQYGLDGKFIKKWEGASVIHRVLGFSQGNISSCARGERPRANGFIWQFKENTKK